MAVRKKVQEGAEVIQPFHILKPRAICHSQIMDGIELSGESGPQRNSELGSYTLTNELVSIDPMRFIRSNQFIDRARLSDQSRVETSEVPSRASMSTQARIANFAIEA